MRRPGDTCGAPGRQNRESGQATVEFALILLPLLILVTGIIYFGIGLNYWLDMNRIANQGARWAAVNNWPPDCPRTVVGTCNAEPPCTGGSRANASLQNTMRCQAVAQGLRSNVAVNVCYPGESPASVDAHDAVKVQVTTPFTFFFIDRFRMNLRANATMRLEVKPTRITGALNACP